MKTINRITLSTSPLSQPARKPRETVNLTRRHRFLYRGSRRYHIGKERDSETGLYYYGARYLDSRTSRWLSGDPAMGEYVPSAPVNDEARKRNKNLPGMGGVFNYVNLYVYHYAGNNPVKYVDPDGRKQNIAQKAFAKILSLMNSDLVQKNTKIEVTRNYYKGIEDQNHSGTYYKDKISIKFKGIPLNSIQAQTTVDYTSRYDASEATPDDTTRRATIGVNAPTNQLAQDTIRFDDEKGNFMHRPVTDNDRPYSGGCAIPPTNADKEEVMDILRNDLGFENGSKIDWTFTKPHTGQPKDNL